MGMNGKMGQDDTGCRVETRGRLSGHLGFEVLSKGLGKYLDISGECLW
jgi:hypothetical protein